MEKQEHNNNNMFFLTHLVADSMMVEEGLENNILQKLQLKAWTIGRICGATLFRWKAEPEQWGEEQFGGS